MLRIAFILAILVGAPTAHAETEVPDSENGRFTLNQVADGWLRLDTRTGQVSLCSKRAAGFTCQVVPDERAALEAEMARLQRENAALKKEMLARGVPLPGGAGADAQGAKPQIELKLPSEAEMDQLIAFMERMWRRLIDMVQRVQKDIDKKG